MNIRALLLSLVIGCISLYADAQYAMVGAGATLPTTCAIGNAYIKTATDPGTYYCDPNNTWSIVGGGGGGPPAGSILMISSGACPAGYAEATELNGVTVIGTLAANANVGTTGGADNVTPTFTGSALGTHTHASGTLATSAHAGGTVDAHSGTAVGDHASHTHTYTQVPNHVHVQNMPSGFTGGSALFATDTSVNGSTASYLSTANPTGGVATGTTAGPGTTLTHSVTQPSAHVFTQPNAHTLSGSTEAVSAGTSAGTNSTLDNRSAFIRVIFCKKT